MPIRGHLGLDGPLLALGVDLEDRGTRLGNFGQVDMYGRSIRVDRHTGFEGKGLPILRETVEKALDGSGLLVLGRARDGQRCKGSNELVIQPLVLAAVEDVTDVRDAATMSAMGVNFPSMSP
jgi:hypothetical protein